MGKSNRLKTNKATSALAAPAKNGKKGMPTWVGTLILVAVLLALVLIVTISVLNSRGTFKRMRVIARSENFKVTVPMMSYMVYTEYQNLVQTYDNLSSQIGTTLPIPGGTGGAALDTSASLRSQIHSVTTDEEGNEVTVTWFDHFAELAMADVEEVLACCEFANYYGIELGEEEEVEIDATIDSLKAYAKTYSETYGGSKTAYLTAMYGEGVIYKDVRAMLELTMLAAKYNEERSAELLAAVGDGRVKEHYEENKDKYDVYMDYMTYTFTATFTPSKKSDKDDAKEENQKLAAEYVAKQEKYKNYVKELGECTTKEAFAAKLDVILHELFLEEEIEAAKKKKDSDTLTDKEMQECRTLAEERLLEEMDAATKINEKVDNVSDAEVSAWLKDSTDPRESGDCKTFATVKDVENKNIGDNEVSKTEGDLSYKDATSNYSAYFTMSGLHRDESTVRAVGHILFKSATFDGLSDITKLSGANRELAERIVKRGGTISAEEMANELITLMKEEKKLVEKTVDGETYWVMDENDFKAYGVMHTEDSNVFYDDVTVGQMVAEFEDWLFDDERVEGEVSDGGIKTSYGYHVMIYRGNERPAWSYNIRLELAEDDHEAWLLDAKEEFPTTFTEKTKYWDMISG